MTACGTLQVRSPPFRATSFHRLERQQRLAGRHPDLIILDIMMPGISGLDILHHMHHDPALTSIPVVVVSAKGTPADIKRGMEAGAKIYLTKPVGFQELKEAVTRALGE